MRNIVLDGGDMKKVWFFLILMGCQAGVGAQTMAVNSLRYWTQPAEARLVVDTTAEPIEDITLLQNPPRLAIELKKARLARGLGQPSRGNRFFANFYTAAGENDSLTIIIELKKTVSYKSFTLTPNRDYGHRLVIDVYDAEMPMMANNTPRIITAKVPMAKNNIIVGDNRVAFEQKIPPRPATIIVAKPVQKRIDGPVVASAALPVNRKSSNNKRAAAKEIIIAIDAGHGGKDPGSHGAGGTEEKQVVFEIAKKLERLIAKQPGMRPVMVREGDQFIKLRQRMQIARAAKADLFVSIHADAFKNSEVKGASVFTLSERGATSEAAHWLADNENAADFVGGLGLKQERPDEVLASVLMDLSQTATIEASGNVAKHVLANFKSINSLHKEAVQKAGFVVLKSPDIPSILVETAFISNPEEEIKLRSDGHQSKIAKAIFNGIVGYFKQYVPIKVPSTHIAGASEVDNG